MMFDSNKYTNEAKNLLRLFNEDWIFTNHLRVIQKSDEFWIKYNKQYQTMNENEKDLFIDITFEATYRNKYLSEKEKIQYEKWLDKLIPDNYFDN